MARKLARGRLVCEPVSLCVRFTAPADAANSNRGGLPLWIDYRGRLTDPFGIPQQGSFEMVFHIADDDGRHLPIGAPWIETHAGVEVANGFFRVALGSATPFPPGLFESGPFNESEPHLRILEVTIDGETVPRAHGLARRARWPLPSGDTALPGLGWRPGDDIEPKISYCISCFERGWQARMTLARNLAVVKDDALAELVFVNFSGDDGDELDDWIRSQFAESIRRNRLLYFRRKERFDWQAARAKNVTHRLATGDILVNLDCDNFIGPKDTDLIRQQFREHRNIVVHLSKWNTNTVKFIERNGFTVENKYRSAGPHEVGDAGRIAIARLHFDALGGYNEALEYMGFQDTDLILRALALGLKYVHVPTTIDGPAFVPNEEAYEENREEWWASFTANQKASEEGLRRGRIVANVSGLSEAPAAYATPNSLIPNIIHFLFFGETPFRFFHYLSILSAYRRARPDAIYVYVHKEPEPNQWWERAKQFVTIEPIDPPREHRGKALKCFQYKADIVRLEKLLERGGIYLDIDVLTLRAFDRLRTYPCVVGGEGYVPGREDSYSCNPCHFRSITNAVLMSVPGSPFLRTWYEELEIDDEVWAGHAVRLPLEIVRRRPEITHVEPVESFMPFDFNDGFIFKELDETERRAQVEARFGRSYCLHLWETIWDKPFLQEINPTYLETRHNIFADLFGDLDS